MNDDFLCMGRFLGLTCLAAGGFLGLTGPLAPRVVDCPMGNEFYNAACGGHVSIEYLFSPLTSYTLSRYAGLRPGGKHVTGFAGRGAPL